MRVYDRDLTGTAASESGRSQDAQKVDRNTGSAPAQAASGTGDRVELSSGLASVSRALVTESSQRSAKLQTLSAEYQAGSYQPSSAAISQGMVTAALSGGGH